MEESARLWNVRQAADYLNTTAHGVYKLVERRQIPYVRLGRKVLFDPSIVRHWIAQHVIPPDANPAPRG